MAIHQVASVAGAQASQALESGKAKFGKTLEQVNKPQVNGEKPGASTQKPGGPQQTQAQSQVAQASSAAKVANAKKAAAAQRVDGAKKSNLDSAAKVLDQVSAAQERLDKVLALAQSGKTFTPAELLSLQAQVCNASQELDLAGKVVEKATGGVKQILQTQV